MGRRETTQVLIAGAGPVGLTLAMDLGRRGIPVIVAEQRPKGARPEPKCNHVAARTMEIFRRLGVVEKVRNAGLPADYPNDVAYRTSFVGEELSRIPIPSRRDRYTATGGPDTWWPTPEPPHRINQIYLEPILFAHAEETRNVRILTSTRVEGVEQNDERVQAELVDIATGERFAIECDYLIGCDGGRSLVRKSIGATLSGTEVVGRVQSTFFRAPDLLARAGRHRPAWATFSLNPSRSGNVYAIDGRETFLLHNYLRQDELEFDAVDRDWAIRTILGVGPDFSYEILSKEDWIGRRLVADRLRDRRIFICGDAAHLWIPMAGYGMNAGIADACNLAFHLAARCAGWASDKALDAYEAERLPITAQVSTFAMNHALALQKEREGVPAGLEEAGPAGDQLRKTTGQALYDLNVKQYCCAGLNFGYFYDQSPVIAYDAASAPSYSMDSFTESTVPGCRAPHLWSAPQQSLYDEFGEAFTLLCLHADADASRVAQAFGARGVPLTVVRVDASSSMATEKYDHPLVLVRSDQHIVWRGQEMPDPEALLDVLCGTA